MPDLVLGMRNGAPGMTVSIASLTTVMTTT